MEERMKYHMTAFFLGFLLDMVFGDPYSLPHPVRLIGSLIKGTEECIRGRADGRRDGKGSRDRGQGKKGEGAARQLRQGMWLVVVVGSVTSAAAACLLLFMYRLHPWAGVVAEAVMTYQTLAAKCLKEESMKVYKSLKSGLTEEARRAVSMIVGRDTQNLNEEGIARAAIETVAENTSDGVIAPMLYAALGGPVLGFLYKAVNTMDSMVGYKNDDYLYFGRAAAKLDDAANYIPARISACLMILAALIGEKCFPGKFAKRLSWRRAVLVYKRDRRKHASPNSAQTESVCAGALGIRLAGDASYFGKTVKKPYIGDALYEVEFEDIRYANRLMYMAAWICEFGCLFLMAIWIAGLQPAY